MVIHETHDFHTDFRVIGKLLGANMNITTDQAIPIAPQANKYIITNIIATNASVSLTTAAGGIYTAISKGGSAVVAAGQVYTALTTTAKYLALTLAGSALTDVYDAAAQANFYLSLTTGQGTAATADIYIYGRLFR